MARRYWPMADLRIRVDGLVLRPLTELDALVLAGLLPDDVELNPDSTFFGGAEPDSIRGTITLQSYWRAMGTWNIDAWRLNFGVWRGDALLGAQELEATDFARLGTVDTASFLVVAARGLGLGKSMRRGVLALAFGPLGAEFAITSAWPDNHASLGVSRALGYAENGLERHRRGEGVDDLVHLRLTRDAWLASGLADAVEIAGFEACRPYFGLI